MKLLLVQPAKPEKALGGEDFSITVWSGSRPGKPGTDRCGPTGYR